MNRFIYIVGLIVLLLLPTKLSTDYSYHAFIRWFALKTQYHLTTLPKGPEDYKDLNIEQSIESLYSRIYALEAQLVQAKALSHIPTYCNSVDATVVYQENLWDTKRFYIYSTEVKDLKKSDLIVYKGYAVGIIDQVLDGFAIGLALQNQSTHLPVINARNNERYILKGLNSRENKMEIKHLDGDICLPKVGDVLIADMPCSQVILVASVASDNIAALFADPKVVKWVKIIPIGKLHKSTTP